MVQSEYGRKPGRKCIAPRRIQRDVRAEDVHKTRQENVWIRDAFLGSNHSTSTTYAIPPWEASVRLVELMEVQRQAAMWQLSQQAKVAKDGIFVVQDFALRLLSGTQIPKDGSAHSYLLDQAPNGSRGHTRNQLLGFESAAGLFAVGRSQTTILPPRLYQRLRNRPLSETGFDLIQGTSSSAAEPLVVDLLDPLFSDHTSDHVTAVQIIAAIERASMRQSPGMRLASLKLKFLQFSDTAPPPVLVLHESKRRRVKGIVAQSGVATATFSGQLGASE